MVKRNRRRNKSQRPAPPELNSEVAGRLNDPYERAFLGVLKSSDSVLSERGGNIQTYLELDKDGKVYAGLQKRILALIGRPWQVEQTNQSGRDQKDAEQVQTILKDCNFDRLCKDLMRAMLCGFAVSEIVWDYQDGFYVPARIVSRAQRRFRFIDSKDGPPELRLLTAQDMVRGEPLPDRKFIVHVFNPENDNPYGVGLGRQLYWPVYFKRRGVVAWNKLNDRFGTPTVWGKYPRGAGEKERQTFFDALTHISSDGVAMSPQGTEIDIIESKLTGSISSQESLCRYMDDWIMEVITGQEPRGQSGGALASASKEREAVRLELTQADSDLLSETLNGTLLDWICDYNGFAPCQVSRTIKADDDLLNMSETDKNIYSLGFNPTEEYIRSRYGEGWEKAAPGTRNDFIPGLDAPTNYAEAAARAERDAIDDIVDDALDGWQQDMGPLVEPILAAVEASTAANETAEQFLARLAALLPELDADPLAETLARATFAARLAGEAGGEP